MMGHAIHSATAAVNTDDASKMASRDRPDAPAPVDLDPSSAADALWLMADKAPSFVDPIGKLDPASSLVQSAADLLRAANDWLDHNRTRPFEARAAERLLRALEEGTTIFCDSFVLVLRETATELDPGDARSSRMSAAPPARSDGCDGL